MSKSSTDQFWNARALALPEDAKVNIADVVQRDYELDFALEHLEPGMRMVEVGCGNGYVTQKLRERVTHVDAFDYAENMIERAKKSYGETNNRFFHDSILAPKIAKGPYDAALCVRVLINLRDLEEQKTAVDNLAALLRQGGRAILIEGYKDGFEEINELRKAIGIAEAKPAAINFYCRLGELMPTIQKHFVVAATFNTGTFDFMTRVVYPALVGADKAVEAGQFHEKVAPIVYAMKTPELARFARLHGFCLIRK